MKKIRIRHQAKPLSPRVIAWGKMLFHLNFRLKRFAKSLEDISPGFGRLLDSLLVEIILEPDFAPARDCIGPGCGQQSIQHIGQSVLAGHRHDIGRRTLHHRDMGRFFRHGRNQGHCRGAAANDGNPFVAVIQIVRPQLGVHDRAGEFFKTGKLGRIASRITVVATAHKQQARPIPGFLTLAVARNCLPDGFCTQPAGRNDAHAEVDVVPHCVFIHRFIQIIEDRWSVRNCLGPGPGLKFETKGVHVTVGPYAGIAKKIPGSPDLLSRFDDAIPLFRTLFFQIAGSADARNARANNHNIQKLLICRVHGWLIAHLICCVF